MAVELTDEEWEVPLDDETEAQITRALADARDPYDYEVATSARYVAVEDLLLLVLKSGRRFAVPVEDLQGLAVADRSLVAKLELDGLYGSFLHWKELDVDFSVLGLADGRYGSEWWMAGLAQRRRERLQKAS